jgi:hypothetical protein
MSPLCKKTNPLEYKSEASDQYGGVKVSTGVWKLGKRAAVGSDCVKKDPLRLNAKTNNNYALAA